jgi:hypothetical protein
MDNKMNFNSMSTKKNSWIKLRKLIEYFYIFLIILIIPNCFTNQNRNQVILRLNPTYNTRSEDLVIANSSETRKFYIEKSHSEIEMKIPKEIIVNLTDIIDGNVSKDLIELNHFALMSALVYPDNTLEESEKKLDDWSEDVKIRTKVKSGSWYQYKTGGLAFQVWKNEKKKIAAIVFRGSQKEWGDWISNFRWFLLPRFNPFIYDQYDQVRDLISELITEISNNYSIVTVGHSLGGGLAQYAAYSGKTIKRVYAFDPSPVTGYYSVEEEIKKISIKELQIYRIYEKGEILSYIRLPMKYPFTFSSVDPEIFEVRHDFLSGGFLEQHDISSFAKELNIEYKKRAK